ncbi:MAG: HAMP domain-containing protein [Thiotrichales bacterium]|nr:HAMP domain-containing protein [Thiotrichales bacterium]MBT4972101.1 HAMP domain-containing protein [Thiotrichales bacterium]MBT7314734.1 HAMP domain-containing protein [Thiotrichales bacterium]
MFDNIKLKQKLLIAFLIVGVVPFSILGLIALDQASSALEKQSFNQLEAVRGIKHDQIDRFFAERQGDMNVLAETVGTLRQEAFHKLTAVRDGKRELVENYLNTVKSQIITMSSDHSIVETMSQLSETFDMFEEDVMLGGDIEEEQALLAEYYKNEFAQEFGRQNSGKNVAVEKLVSRLDMGSTMLQYTYISSNPHPLGSKHKLDIPKYDISPYAKLHKSIHPSFRSFTDQFGYYDLFFVGAESGKVVYSVFKELDYATSLVDGPYAKTGIGRVFKKAMAVTESGKYVFEDYSQYLPSYNAPASFIASPIFSGDEKIGVLIFQMPIDEITSVMSGRTGMGKTGESYLIGSDRLMRSDSYLNPEHHSVLSSFRNPAKGSVETSASKAALRGETDSKVIIDYNGNPVLSSYAPLNALGAQWAILSEIDVAEAFVPIIKGAEKDYYSKYIEESGYYDLFLMNPDGYLFYSVAKESDYQTNMVNGRYSDSNLGKLMQQVLQTKKYGIADFAPYAPSNGEPAAFIARPILYNGEVEMVVALQLPLDGINAIMSQREGMGESGETYLIGQDLLMRSDSFLDPENHSVMTSFKNPELGKVDTVAAHSALAGERDSKIIVDYNGNPVLSAYTPVEIGAVSWALLAEIDEAEAFFAVNTLRNLMFLVGGLGLLAIIAIGWLVARAITVPIIKVTDLFGQLEKTGDFSLRCIGVSTKDEIGGMADRVNGLLELLQDSISNASNVVGAISRGDFEQRMNGDYIGDLSTLKEGVNGSADSVENTMHALGKVMKGLGDGDLSVRMDDSVEEIFRDQVNGAMSSIDEVLQQVGNIIERLAQGDFDARMGYDAKGDLETLSKNINGAMGDLQTSIAEVVETSNRMGEGDLTKNIEGNYLGSLGLLKDAINATQTNISGIVSQVRYISKSVNTGSAEISRGSLDLSSRTSEQAASLEETAASMEEMSSTVTMNADNAAQASDLAGESLRRAIEGADVVSNAVDAMEGINTSSNKISEIITLIDGIAFQTNLLALNAAVEAARAGEHGRGFAVVAGEVRTLAQRSADAAKDIKGLIEDSTSRIQEGTKLVNHSGDALEHIQESVKKLNDIAGEIALAAKEQTQGIDQVNTAIGQLDSVTQENAALVEETAAASSQLSEQASSLSETVSLFKLEGSFKQNDTPAQEEVQKQNQNQNHVTNVARPRSSVVKRANVSKGEGIRKRKDISKGDDWSEF